MTPLIEIQNELEEYFAKKYTKKYIEFGGYFHFRGIFTRDYSKSPMQKYFISGKYKELNDPKLDYYWDIIKTKRAWSKFIITIILLIVILAGY